MRLRKLKEILKNEEHLTFKLPSGELVPKHFHVTEVGKIEKNFIDCGGTLRNESMVSFQLWYSVDDDHKLGAEKLLSIIKLSEEKLGLIDAEIEVEYQSDTIGKYGLEYENGFFLLQSKMTDCLAKDNCGIPQEKPRIKLSEIASQNECTPGSGCC